jgi:hypothetical protein
MIVGTEHSESARSRRSHTKRDPATDMMGVPNAAPHADHVTEKAEFDRRDGQAAIAIALLGRDWS